MWSRFSPSGSKEEQDADAEVEAVEQHVHEQGEADDDARDECGIHSRVSPLFGRHHGALGDSRLGADGSAARSSGPRQTSRMRK